MKVYQTNEIKNIALLGNDGSGKTTLTEALLFESGIIKTSRQDYCQEYSQRLLPGGAGIRLFCVFHRFPCGVERQETEYH